MKSDRTSCAQSHVTLSVESAAKNSRFPVVSNEQPSPTPSLPASNGSASTASPYQPSPLMTSSARFDASTVCSRALPSVMLFVCVLIRAFAAVRKRSRSHLTSLMQDHIDGVAGELPIATPGKPSDLMLKTPGKSFNSAGKPSSGKRIDRRLVVSKRDTITAPESMPPLEQGTTQALGTGMKFKRCSFT